MAYRDFKDLARRTASDKILCDEAFNIAKNPKDDGYQRGLASMIYKLFDKKLLVAVLKMRICQSRNYQKNYINQLLEDSIKERYNHLL